MNPDSVTPDLNVKAAAHDPDHAPLAPIYADTSTPPSTDKSRSPLDWIVALVAVSIALIALMVAILQIVAFAATDQVPLQLLQWSALMLGLAGLAVVPFGLVALWAWHAQPRLWPTLLLMAPWVIVGGLWIVLSDYDGLIGALPGVAALIAILRAILAHRKKPLDSHNPLSLNPR